MREIKDKILSSSALIWGIAVHLFVQVHCMSYSCEVAGKFEDPDDEHKYHHCYVLYGSLNYLHNIFPMKTCFNTSLIYCNTQSCSDYVPGSSSYNCETKNDKSYPCKEKGYVADPNDPGYYYNCVEVNGPSGKVWESWCYTCSSTHKTCYSDALKTCMPCTGGDGNPKLTYDSKGYNHLSFPCEQHSGKKASGTQSDAEEYIGIFANPGDQSTYYECYFRAVKPVAECKSCKNHEVFDNLAKKCVLGHQPPPPPEPIHKPYDCSTRTLTSYPCTNGGFVADSTDRSIFYHCVQKGSNWESRCYSCSSKQKTCFSNVIQACIPCDYKEGSGHDKGTWGGTGVGGTGVGGTGVDGSGPSTKTYDCAGYQSYSIPCTQIDNGMQAHSHPGDSSVYFICGKKGAVCTSCNKATEESYNSVTRECELPHGHDIIVLGKMKPYSCYGYNSKSYPCSKEGHFPHPKDHTVYFSCFQQQVVVEGNTKKKGGIGLGKKFGILGGSIGGGFKFGGGSLFSANVGVGIPGVKSKFDIQIGGKKGSKTTVKLEWASKCYFCNPTTKSCFKYDVQECVSECKTGGETGSYNCAGYQNNVTPETSCDALLQKKQKFFGLFGDKSVYFECTKIKRIWVYKCFECPQGSCYVQDSQSCVACGGEKFTMTGRSLSQSKSQKKKGSSTSSTSTPQKAIGGRSKCKTKFPLKTYPCTQEGFFPHKTDDYHKKKQKNFAVAGDKTLYFECEKIQGIWYYNCIECPPGDCFVHNYQRCVPCRN